mgnify:CR=1 FL=1
MKPVTRKQPLLATQPPAPVRSIGELYAIAMTQAGKAAQRYGQLAAAGDDAFEPVRCVFEVLHHRELERAESIKKDCVAAIGRAPDVVDLRWTPTDLVPAQELSDMENSLLSTAYGAWALAVRHRERAFVFWTYVAALAESVGVRTTAEDLAREALHDGNLLRRERRLAWRAERKSASDKGSTNSEISTAALLESLLLKDILLWSQEMPPPQRGRLLSLIGSHGEVPAPETKDAAMPGAEPLEEIKRRAQRHAEQLCTIYLDEADSAVDQSGLELAQQLATRSIARLADLRALASLPG